MHNTLRVNYDAEAGAAYIYLTGSIGPGGAKRTLFATPQINLDFDAQGCLIGIELLSPSLLHPVLASQAEKLGQ